MKKTTRKNLSNLAIITMGCLFIGKCDRVPSQTPITRNVDVTKNSVNYKRTSVEDGVITYSGVSLTKQGLTFYAYQPTSFRFRGCPVPRILYCKNFP